MNGPAFAEGDYVAVLPLSGIDAAADRRLAPWVGKTGTVEKSWCFTRDDMPDLVKMVVYPDVWCCDVRLDDGEIVRGIPEVALDRRFPKRT